MFIQKIFHLHQPLDEARERVADYGAIRELEIDRATFRNGIGHFEVETGLGDRLAADIRRIEETDPNRMLFHSVGGDVELVGMVEFAAIRENLTEVTFTLEYEMSSPLQRAFDMLTSSFDKFLNRQLIRLENRLHNPPAATFIAVPSALAA